MLPFAHIQKRLGRKVLTPKILRDNPAAFIAFDMLYRDGELLMDQPLRERRAALDRALRRRRRSCVSSRRRDHAGLDRRGDRPRASAPPATAATKGSS